MGIPPPHPPSAAAAGLEASRELFAQAGLESIQTTQITVERTFRDAEDYWAICLKGPGTGGKMKSLPEDQLEQLHRRVIARLPGAPLTVRARANAIKARLP
jgi:hypothetical protein